MMSEKTLITVLTPCHFLFAGLESLLKNTLISPQVKHVVCINEALIQQAVSGAEMVIVAQDSNTPTGIARAWIQLRSLDWLMMTGAMKRVPCLLLAGDMSVTVSGRKFWLTRKYAGLDLEILLCSIMDHKELYQDMSVWFPLTEQQKIILSCTLAGFEVESMAAQMHILPSTVFAHRDNLIKKLGLRNRMALMCLSSRDFADMQIYTGEEE
ncbi:helix-turn-helix transcriptional regulator [Salmonella enterica subsp. enterica serovar Sandiego]|nr:helix-turn-helix transcriptional regulator [Salmonella enterica subsp. enterica serovar Sandiego]